MALAADRIPSGWCQGNLGDIALLRRETVAPAAESKAKYVGLQHIEKDSGKLLGHGEATEVRSLKSAFEEGDILYGRLRPNLNKVWRATFNGMCSTEIFVFRKLQNINSDFLAYRLLCDDFVQFAVSRVSGMQYPRVRFESLLEFELLLPPLGEQCRIAERVQRLLDRIEFATSLARAAQARIADYRQALLADAFSGELTGEWRSQNPNSDPPERLLQQVSETHRATWIERETARTVKRVRKATASKLPLNYDPATLRQEVAKAYSEPTSITTNEQTNLPAGWASVNWSQIVFVQNGRSFPSSDYVSEGVRLLRPGNLAADGTIVWSNSNTRYLRQLWADDFPEFIVGGGELLMNLTAQSLADEFLGRVCMTRADEHCLLNQRIARLSVVSASTRYIYYLLRSSRFRRFVDTLNTGSLIQHISTSQLVSLSS
jgi:Type I restriction modification DNA specificity domain